MDPNGGKKNLFNKLGRVEAISRLKSEPFKRITISFYKYVIIDDPFSFRDELFLKWNALAAFGRIYLANEGINAQMSIPEHNWKKFEIGLSKIKELKEISFKIAVEDDGKSFFKLTIKVRKKIVADGLSQDEYDVTNVGKHLTAKQWNQAIEEGATVVDMRNHYESEICHFDGAITPDVDTFRDSLDIIEEDLKENKENKNLLMYCTGGIRCEKASAYYKHKGFKNVFQLEGGIIEYARQVKSERLENKFLGKNFVFDHRRAEKISEDIIANCHQCGNSCDTHVNCANEACHLLFIQCNDCSEKMENTCSPECKEVIKLSYEEQKALRKGTQASNKIFKKGRSEKLKFNK